MTYELLAKLISEIAHVPIGSIKEECFFLSVTSLSY